MESFQNATIMSSYAQQSLTAYPQQYLKWSEEMDIEHCWVLRTNNWDQKISEMLFILIR